MTVYLDLTREFNAGRLRAVICGGQATVLHRLAVASKDGAWILREDVEALEHVLAVLGRHCARYRFGAPLDLRWLAGGWSSHFESASNGVRTRTDFFTRPPRIDSAELARMWKDQEGRDPPFTDARILAEMKKTDRQRDYPFIGELARLMGNPRDQLLYSRSADDLIELGRRHPELARSLVAERPLLGKVTADRRVLAEALQLEMLDMMETNERRLAAYAAASSTWADRWPALSRELDRMPLPAAHEQMVARAAGVLPERPRS